MPQLDDSFTRSHVGLLLLNFSGLLLAWIFGKLDFSLWWILAGSLVWWFGLRRREKSQKAEKVYLDVRDDERATVMAGLGELPSWVFFPDVERCEWLNRIIDKLWPHIGKYGEKYVIQSIEPVMQKSMPLAFKFVKIDMGDHAMRIGGVKVYAKEQSARGELIMDMEICYSGDAQIKFRVGPAVAGIKDIQCRGTLRVICKPLVDDMPFVGGITAYFLHTPSIDFNLTNLADAFDLPGVAEIIRKVVYEQVNHMFVLPNKFSLALIPDVSQYELKFIEPDGVLRLHMREARDLVKKDIGLLGKGKSDPYCIIRVGSQEFRTRVINNTVAPVWDQWFEAVVDHAAMQTLEIELFDEDPGSKDDFLGRCTVDILAIAKQGSMDQWMQLEDAKHGELRVEASWLAISSESAKSPYLEQILHETAILTNNSHPLGTCLLMMYFDSAQALPLARKSPTEPHPYLHATCGKETFKTFTRPSTCNPVWEEQKIFVINDPRTQYVKCEIMDEKSTKRLGYVDVAVASLIEKSDMQINAPFSLLGDAGTDSRLNMRLKLRMLRTGPWDQQQQQQLAQHSGAMPLKAGTSAKPQTSQSAGKYYADNNNNKNNLTIADQQQYSKSAQSSPAGGVPSNINNFNNIRPPTPNPTPEVVQYSETVEEDVYVDDQRRETNRSQMSYTTTSTAPVNNGGGGGAAVERGRATSPLSAHSTSSSSAEAAAAAAAAAAGVVRSGGGRGDSLQMNDDGVRRRAQSSSEPRMQLTIAHNRNKEVLTVTVHECNNLDKLFLKSGGHGNNAASHFHEPYVSVHLLPGSEKRKTPEYEKHRTDPMNPRFDCTLEFPCEHEERLRTCTLSLKVKHKKGLFGKVDTIGAVKVSLDPIAETGPLGLRGWYTIDPDVGDDDDSVSRK